jgi:cytochrome c oxidase cbb3-type subunit II
LNKINRIFWGVLVLFGASWLGLVAYPYLTFAALQPNKDEATGEVAPLGKPGTAEQGYHVYASNGCVYCHSQVVRDKEAGSDIDRGWGKRRTVARDYLFDRYVFLGTARLGDDLANVGVRQTDPQWFYRYLYAPKTFNAETIMPAHKWLFKTMKIEGQSSLDALKLEGENAPASGFEVVPTADGKALVDYLLALKKNYVLPEAPEPKE